MPRQLQFFGERELPTARLVQLVLVQIGDYLGPSVDRLTALQPYGIGHFLSGTEELDDFSLLHALNGKTSVHAMSIALTANLSRVMHNPGMAKSITDDTGGHFPTLVSRLEHAMKLRGTNPNQIAESTGVARQTLYAVLNGPTQNFTWPVLYKICRYLGVNPRWMAEGEMPIEPVSEIRDDEEHRLLLAFRRMSMSHQRDLFDIAARWAEEDTDGAGNGRPFDRPIRKQ